MQVLRFRCPCCGHLPTLENLQEAVALTPEVRIVLQKFGGKAPPPGGSKGHGKVGKGGAPGHMEYEDVTDQHPTEVAKMTEFFAKRASAFLKLEMYYRRDAG